jgi:flagellar basal-body rod modification protein FlgD
MTTVAPPTTTALPAAATALPTAAATNKTGSATSSTGSATSSAETEPTNPKGELGKNAFLQLMVAQLQAQNPLEPSNGTEYISELAQFSQLEQTTNIAQSSTQSVAAQRVAQAVGLIGHTVSYTDPSTGATHSGPVQSVEITTAGATLTIEGTPGIELAGVTEVA